MFGISFYGECVALIASIFLFFSDVPKYYRAFFFYMLVTVLVESSGYLYRMHYHQSNLFIFNVFIPLEAIFFIWFFSKSLDNKKTTSVLYIALGVFLPVSLVNDLFVQSDFSKLHTYDLIVSNILLSAIAIFYLQDTEYKKGSVGFLYEPIFWISCGLLAYVLPMSILYSCFEYLAYKKTESYLFYNIYSFMNNLCNILEYLCFSIGCLCRLSLKTSY